MFKLKNSTFNLQSNQTKKNEKEIEGEQEIKSLNLISVGKVTVFAISIWMKCCNRREKILIKIDAIVDCDNRLIKQNPIDLEQSKRK